MNRELPRGVLLKRVAIILALLVFWIAVVPRAFAQSCPAGSHPLTQTLPAGSGWELCWKEDAAAGIVLSNVVYTTRNGISRQVLSEAGLGQINVMVDDESTEFSHVSSDGLGGANLVGLGAPHCSGGQLLATGGRNVVCKTVEDRGYAFKYYSQYRRGERLSLSSKMSTASGDYVLRWNLFDDGTIEPEIGHTGEITFVGEDSRYGWRVNGLSSSPVIAKGLVIEYIWRLDFGIGSNANDDVVEMLQVVPSADRTKKQLSVTTVNNEAAWQFHPDTKRSWRVRDAFEVNADGHPVSYHLEPVNTGNIFRSTASRPWSQNDVFVTRFNDCERIATGNTEGSCATSVEQFANGQSLGGQDVVLWYRTSWRRLPRVEDRDGMKTGWSRFRLVPRDWTATTPMS